MSESRTIVVGVTGSIAAYKSADLVSKLVKRNYDVFVVMTQGAQEFVADKWISGAGAGIPVGPVDF